MPAVFAAEDHWVPVVLLDVWKDGEDLTVKMVRITELLITVNG